MEEIDETVTVPQSQYDEIVEKLASETQSKVNLVNEIKELREKKQLTEREAEELRKKLESSVLPPQSSSGVLTSEQIEEIALSTMKSAFAAKDTEEAQANKVNAMNSFLGKHKEFHPDNDPGGIKLSALEQKFARFNTEGLKKESDFLSVLEDASSLVRPTQQSQTPGIDPNPPAPTGTQSGTPASEMTDDKLSQKEITIINRSFDGDRERYLKIKQKRPDYVASLLQYSL